MRYLKTILVVVAVGAGVILSSVKISYSSYLNEEVITKEVLFEPVIHKLLSRGCDTNFVYRLISDPRTHFDEKFVRINVTGHLTKTDYSHNYSPKSVERTRCFISDNYAALSNAETKYGVPKEIIASILWVETRHGDYLGRNHMPSVFLSTAMADQPQFLEMNKKVLKEKFDGSPEELPDLEEKILKKALRKVNWAIDELIALQKLARVSPVPVLEINGSWAGAFGISQFLPSSYLKWAVDGNGDGKINIFDIDDAIFSVGNYLAGNGWGTTEEEHRNAVYNYNNSYDYVDAVMKLARLVSEADRREEDSDSDYYGPYDKQMK